MRQKRLFSLALPLVLLCGCSLQRPAAYQGRMPIPESGIVEADVLRSMQQDGAVVTFTGSSGGCEYEWVIFGETIVEPKDLALAVAITEDTETPAVTLRFAAEESFGFSPLLSVSLHTDWDCRSAVVFDESGEPLGTATVTGSGSSILNLTADGTGCCTIRPEMPAETEPCTEAPTQAPTEPPTEAGTEAPTEPETTAPTEPVTEIPEAPAPTEPPRALSDGSATGQDRYKTDPVPEGRPLPVEPEEAEVNTAHRLVCTFSIECATVLNNLDMLDPDKVEVVPADGVLLAPCEVEFSEGESVFDVLQRLCQERGIHLESAWTPVNNSAYIEGIGNLYEFDCGVLSGWMYCVNGWYPNYGCSRYQLTDGEVVEWRYSCDLGADIGGGNRWEDP